MSIAQREIITEPRPYRWTREEYYKLGEQGFFKGSRVELIEGEVFEMSPIYSPHTAALMLAAEVLRALFGEGWSVREQQPLSLGVNSDPQPDIAVVAGAIRDYKDAHPTTAALVIEIADSTVSYDRNRKGSLYAKAGIADYWITNLKKRQLEVRRQPKVDASTKYGFSYASVQVFKEGDLVSPLAKPDAMIPVTDLLP